MGMKTKIHFDEIKPGDTIEVIEESDGVKTVETGIAHEHEGNWALGSGAWYTEEGGLLIVEDNSQTIYRLDDGPVKFADLKVGDRIRVSFPPIQHSISRHGDITWGRTGTIAYIDDTYGDVLTVSGERLLSRSDFFENAQVEVL